MSVRPNAGSSLPTPLEMAQLVAQAGLTLNAGQMADLALAWRQLVGLVARIPRERLLLDDQAFVFRLPPPAAPAATPRKPAPRAKTAAKRAAKPKAARARRSRT